MLAVSDGAAAIVFYQEALGAIELWRIDAGGQVVAGLSVDGAELFLATSVSYKLPWADDAFKVTPNTWSSGSKTPNCDRGPDFTAVPHIAVAEPGEAVASPEPELRARALERSSQRASSYSIPRVFRCKRTYLRPPRPTGEAPLRG